MNLGDTMKDWAIDRVAGQMPDEIQKMFIGEDVVPAGIIWVG
jgi:hypothetical protein